MKIPIPKFSLILVLFGFALLANACGPSARDREQQRLEDSIQLDQDRRQLLERTEQMLDSVQTPASDSL